MAKLDVEKLQQIARGEIKASEVLDVNVDQMAAVLMVGHLLYENGKLAEAQRIFDGLLLLDTQKSFPACHAGIDLPKATAIPNRLSPLHPRD